MKLSVTGCGYRGAVHAAAMASIGHKVVGVDVVRRKIDSLSNGIAPFLERGLEEMLEAEVAGDLRFTTSMAVAEGAIEHGVGVGVGSVLNGMPFSVTDCATAELVKVSAIAFLATKISFINAMAEIAQVTGTDVTRLADAIGHDVRIGRRFLGAGIGFGGGCVPDDIRAFSACADELRHGESIAFLRQVDEINLRCNERTVQLVIEGLDGAVSEENMTVLGAVFKPHSDEVRGSPALDFAVRLHGLGADVEGTDPGAIDNTRRLHPQLTYMEDRDDAIRDADAPVRVTGWDEYRLELPPEFASSLARGVGFRRWPKRPRRRRLACSGVDLSRYGPARGSQRSRIRNVSPQKEKN